MMTVGSCPLANSIAVSNTFQVPSFDTVATLPESALNEKLYTPLECPVRSKALATFSNSPDLLNLTSHTLTSGVKPEVATNLPQGDTLQQ